MDMHLQKMNVIHHLLQLLMLLNQETGPLLANETTGQITGMVFLLLSRIENGIVRESTKEELGIVLNRETTEGLLLFP